MPVQIKKRGRPKGNNLDCLARKERKILFVPLVACGKKNGMYLCSP